MSLPNRMLGADAAEWVGRLLVALQFGILAPSHGSETVTRTGRLFLAVAVSGAQSGSNPKAGSI